MKKTVLSLFLISITSILSAQSFSALYSFSLVTSTSGTVDPTPVPAVANATMGSFSSINTSTLASTMNSTAGSRFSYTGWAVNTYTPAADTYSAMTGAIDLTHYYQVTLTPNTGYAITLSDISFGIRRSGTGIRNYAVRYSVDNYGTNLPASVGTNTNLSVVGSNEFFWNFDATSTSVDQIGSMINLSNTTFTNAVTFRFYAWNSEQSGGTFSIDNVLITGTVVSTATCVVTTTSVQFVMPVTCNGLANGSATISAMGDGPLTYTWMPSGGNTSMASGLAAGIYSCIVTNTCGIATTQTVQITQPTALSSTTTVNNVLCNGGATGSATLTVSGGTTGYTYSWSNGAISSVISSVSLGVYTATVTDGNGCMAVKNATITEPNAIMVSKSYTLCAGQTVTVGANTYSAAGTYTDVLTSMNSCDSTVVSTINVINALDNSVTINGLTLSANQTGATYKWVDCNNNNAIIANATSQTYSATSNGNYAVIVTIGNCSATSTCNIVTTVGLKSYNVSNSVSIYPNPTSGLLHIDLPAASTETLKLEIRNAIGQTVYSNSLINEHQAINIQHLSAGIYYVLVGNQKPVKLIKQ